MNYSEDKQKYKKKNNIIDRFLVFLSLLIILVLSLITFSLSPQEKNLEDNTTIISEQNTLATTERIFFDYTYSLNFPLAPLKDFVNNQLKNFTNEVVALDGASEYYYKIIIDESYENIFQVFAVFSDEDSKKTMLLYYETLLSTYYLKSLLKTEPYDALFSSANNELIINMLDYQLMSEFSLLKIDFKILHII